MHTRTCLVAVAGSAESFLRLSVQHPHSASHVACASLQNGGQVPKVMVLTEKELGGRCITARDLALEVRRLHICHILFSKAITEIPPTFKGGENRPYLLVERG